MVLWQEIREDWRWYRGIPDARSPLREAGFWICAVHRLGWRARQNRTPLIGSLMRASYLAGKLLVLAVTGADIRSGAQIGRHFTVHTSQGILIADEVVIGDDCVINTGVCLVNKANGQREGVAVLGDRVWLAVGAKIVGGVKIGDGVTVGANAVVLTDVPAGRWRLACRRWSRDRKIVWLIELQID